VDDDAQAIAASAICLLISTWARDVAGSPQGRLSSRIKLAQTIDG
jgi:hypothetical protein